MMLPDSVELLVLVLGLVILMWDNQLQGRHPRLSLRNTVARPAGSRSRRSS